MHQIKTVFAGTHEFAAIILGQLITFPFLNITAVITQPDKPAGRKKTLTPPPVKIIAEQIGIPTEQPSSLKNYTFTEIPELIIVAQYGKIIPENILAQPKYGVINTHTSLLPKYRGASPIQSALINGETKTGVTIMKMDIGLDTGPILLQTPIDIFPDETYLELDKRMAILSVNALKEALPPYLFENKKPIPQDNAAATHCKQLNREDGKINWENTTQGIYNQYRGLTPWPGIWTTWEEKRLKLLNISPSKTVVEAGKILIKHDTIYIGTSDYSITAQKVQLEGKPAIAAKEFISGYKTRIDGATLL